VAARPQGKAGRAATGPESYGGRGPPLRDSGLRYLPTLWGSKTWLLLLTYGVIGVSGCGFVLVDEAVEDSSSSDLVGREIGWRRLEWLGWPTLQGPVGAGAGCSAPGTR
jgi:hypothetical protein